jgi:hypothetical protein
MHAQNTAAVTLALALLAGGCGRSSQGSSAQADYEAEVAAMTQLDDERDKLNRQYRADRERLEANAERVSKRLQQVTSLAATVVPENARQSLARTAERVRQAEQNLQTRDRELREQYAAQERELNARVREQSARVERARAALGAAEQ